VNQILSLIRGWRGIFLVQAMVAWAPALAIDGAPEALSPSGPVPRSDPAFQWAPLPGAELYRLNIRNAAKQPVFNRWYYAWEAGCGDGEELCTVQVGDSFAAASFRWRVIARDVSGDDSSWSAWQTFFPGQVDIPPPPPAPFTDQPFGVVGESSPEFSWQPVVDGTRYWVKVVDSDNRRVFSRKQNAKRLGCADGISPCTMVSSKLFAEGGYRWKVQARNGLTGAKSDWSPWTSFEIPSAAERGSGLDQRPSNPSCTLPEAPPRISNVVAERVFPSLQINDVVILVRSPANTGADDRWFAVMKNGLVESFDSTNPSSATTEPFLDISDRVLTDTGETGLLGMAFHPGFPADNRAFLLYTNKVDGEYESYLSEFLSLDNGQSLDPSSERRLVTLSGHANHQHKGGTIIFGPDGYLYLSLGDGGRKNESQNPFSLFGTLIRIDVDNGDPYAIPPDNPFADGIDGAPEIYAYGFRNPWRWSFDSSSGLIWLTDVGQSMWEEINIVTPGANYGWPIVEGPDCFQQIDCDREGLTPPIFSYPHDSTGGVVIVGGFVYRGSALPELGGTFVYADGTGRVWALYVDYEGQPDPELLIDGGLPGSIIHSMFEDQYGELYLVKGGFIFRLVPGDGEATFDFPTALSDTGCVDPANPTVPAEGLIPYGVNSPFWTDGAAKSRWLSLPDESAVEVDTDGDFHFPPGSVLVKEFRLHDRRIETRLFARHDDGKWAGYSYAWNEDETEAELVGSSGRQIQIEGQNYNIPGRGECLFCHSEAAGRTLGLEIRQLNGLWHYESTGRSANQLTTFEAIGLLDQALPDRPPNLPALVSLDDHTASFSDRARSYLHANCSSCHRPGGPGRGPADMRFQPLQAMNICDVLPEVSDLGIDQARLLAPGAPERSIIPIRMGLLGPDAMPPIGKNVVDIDATAIVEEWISGQESCAVGR